MVSFHVTRSYGTNTVVVSYTGTVDGDTIKGTTSSERDGQNRSHKWEAKREANTAVQ
jgi:hypothetical protein